MQETIRNKGLAKNMWDMQRNEESKQEHMDRRREACEL